MSIMISLIAHLKVPEDQMTNGWKNQNTVPILRRTIMKSRSVANDKSRSPNSLWLVLSPTEHPKDQLKVIVNILSVRKRVVLLNGAGISINSGDNLESALPATRAYVHGSPRF